MTKKDKKEYERIENKHSSLILKYLGKHFDIIPRLDKFSRCQDEDVIANNGKTYTYKRITREIIIIHKIDGYDIFTPEYAFGRDDEDLKLWIDELDFLVEHAMEKVEDDNVENLTNTINSAVIDSMFKNKGNMFNNNSPFWRNIKM